ncbi:MAG: hypothetical protein JWR77_732, partial [Rhizorhabdus sp.]|nr:hypothetical protein [Rhizorhabdus sp.]
MTYSLLIDGKLQPGASTFDVV